MSVTEFLRETKQYTPYEHLHFKVSKGYLPKALKFNRKNIPEERGYMRTLKDCFDSLERICKNCGNIAVIYEDFVKHSFYFVMYRKGTNQRDFNGGVILHGFQETFSVELNSPSQPHYSIHT